MGKKKQQYNLMKWRSTRRAVYDLTLEKRIDFEVDQMLKVLDKFRVLKSLEAKKAAEAIDNVTASTE